MRSPALSRRSPQISLVMVSICSTTSERLESPVRDRHHAEQQKGIGKAGDLRGAVGPGRIADRYLHDLQVELGGAEQQIKVAERVELTEVRPIGGDPLVIGLGQ